MSAPSYRFGIEEEYFLADAETRGTPRGDLAAFHARVEAERVLNEDPSLERYVTDRRITVEVCLTSNVQTRAVARAARCAADRPQSLHRRSARHADPHRL